MSQAARPSAAVKTVDDRHGRLEGIECWCLNKQQTGTGVLGRSRSPAPCARPRGAASFSNHDGRSALPFAPLGAPTTNTPCSARSLCYGYGYGTACCCGADTPPAWARINSGRNATRVHARVATRFRLMKLVACEIRGCRAWSTSSCMGTWLGHKPGRSWSG